MLTGEGARYAMVQEFLPRVVEGDKRVLLLEGKILGAINRIPRGDDLRSNIHVGGRVEPCTLTAHEQHIVASIAPRLVRDGLYFVGLDMVGEKLTEVNVTSPTGIQELSQHLGRDAAEDVVRWAAARVAAKNS
jgi:glutathione synthase